MTSSHRSPLLALALTVLLSLGCFINHRSNDGECQLNDQKTCDGDVLITCEARCLGSEGGRCEEPEIVRQTCSNTCNDRDSFNAFCEGTCGPSDLSECTGARTIRSCQLQSIPNSNGLQEYNWVEEECANACDSNFGQARCSDTLPRDETPDTPPTDQDTTPDSQDTAPDLVEDASADTPADTSTDQPSLDASADESDESGD